MKRQYGAKRPLKETRPAQSGRAAKPEKGADLFDRSLTTWREGSITYFKIGDIPLDETADNEALEAAARRRAKPIEAQVTYAYCLARPQSSAWWQEWGGFELEPEIAYCAVLRRKDVAARLAAFDPAEPPPGCTSLPDFEDVLFVEYRDRLNRGDILRGYRAWHRTLSRDAQELFLKDMQRWLDDRDRAGRKAAQKT